MEQQVFSKFNLYDQIGYLMVGSIAIIIFLFDIKFFYNFPIPELNLNTFLVWFIVVYFLGHLIQSISNLISKITFINALVKEDKKDFSDEEKEILKDAKEFFKSKFKDNDSLWNVCYLFSLSKDSTGQIEAFNAYYSMYRGWLLIFIFQTIFMLYFLFVKFNLINLDLFLISLLITIVFYFRSKRFWNYLRKKVLQAYIIARI